MLFVDMLRRLIGQIRVCPSCGHRQPTLKGDSRRERCERCGAVLPGEKEKRG